MNKENRGETEGSGISFLSVRGDDSEEVVKNEKEIKENFDKGETSLTMFRQCCT